MQAYYEMDAVVSKNHQLSIQLPDNIPIGLVKIAVIYPLTPAVVEKKSLDSVIFFAECRRQSLLIKNDAQEHATQQWLEALADSEGWE